MTNEDRRSFIKGGGAAALGAAAVTAVPGAADAQNVKLNPSAVAVLPSGKELSRGEVLMELGLDPSTPPDAWLAIFGCGSNASALKPDALRTLVDRGMLDRSQLDATALGKLK